MSYEYKKANFDVSQMTVEEVEKRLADMGFPVGNWSAPPSGDGAEDRVIKTLPTFQKQAVLLDKLRELLGNQIDEDRKTINTLAEKRARLLHGGGR